MSGAARRAGADARARWSHAAVFVADDCVAGRGVRAARAFLPGELIESCPLLVVPGEQLEALDATAVYDFYYSWQGGAAIALGYGSLYNHSACPNADYLRNTVDASIEIVAVTAVACGDEIRIDYSRGGTNPLWFEPVAEPTS